MCFQIYEVTKVKKTTIADQIPNAWSFVEARIQLWPQPVEN